MKKILLLIVIAAFAWKLYERPRTAAHAVLPVSDATGAPPTVQELVAAADRNFRCDGRLHCSQMTSCEEATWFLKNCPGTKMDGDHDGIPCEEQYCH